jgi:hypothetical protein
MKSVAIFLIGMGMMIPAAQADWVCSTQCSIPVGSVNGLSKNAVDTSQVGARINLGVAKKSKAVVETGDRKVGQRCEGEGSPSAKHAVLSLKEKLENPKARNGLTQECSVCKGNELEKAVCTNRATGQTILFATLKSRLGMGDHDEKGGSAGSTAPTGK